MGRVRPADPILVVDDNQETRDVLERVLEIRGYTTVAARNGKEALRYLRDGNPVCLIILDLYMPVMDGWEFSRALKADPALRHIPVIAYSAGTNADLPEATAFVRKALDPEVLLALVEQHCLRGAARPS